jgi:hypothetical protein
METDRPLSGAELADIVRQDRAKRRKKSKKDADAGWEIVDFDQERFVCRYIDPVHTFARLDFGRNASMIEIFRSLCPEQFLMSLIERRLTEDPAVFRHGTKTWQVTLPRLVQAIAIFVRIQGLHRVPEENTVNTGALKHAFAEAIGHFRATSADVPGINFLLRLHANLYICTREEQSAWSLNQQAALVHLGESLAGDEKLVYFTGNSGFIRKVPSKPGGIGLWNYMAAVKVHNDIA